MEFSKPNVDSSNCPEFPNNWKTNYPNYLEILPKHILIAILQYLPCEDLDFVKKVDSVFKQIICNHKHEVIKFERDYKATFSLWQKGKAFHDSTCDTYFFTVQLKSVCECAVHRRNIVHFLATTDECFEGAVETVRNCANTHATRIIPKSYVSDNFLKFDKDGNVDEESIRDAFYNSLDLDGIDIEDPENPDNRQNEDGEIERATGLTLLYTSFAEAKKALDKFLRTLSIAAPYIDEIKIECISNDSWELSADSLELLNFPYLIPMVWSIEEFGTSTTKFFAWRHFENYDIEEIFMNNVSNEFLKHKFVKKADSLTFGENVKLDVDLLKTLNADYLSFTFLEYNQKRLNANDVRELLKHFFTVRRNILSWNLPIVEGFNFDSLTSSLPGKLCALPQKYIWEFPKKTESGEKSEEVRESRGDDVTLQYVIRIDHQHWALEIENCNEPYENSDDEEW